jgi:hypothetical protein
MTKQKALKRRIRVRMQRTGERYTQARAALLAKDDEPGPATGLVRAVVLKVQTRSARVRFFGEPEEVTLRTSSAWSLVPGHVVEVHLAKRWAFRGHAYASGVVARTFIDVAVLDLQPLPLAPIGEMDLRAIHEPFDGEDPYAPVWLAHTRRPRPAFEFHDIAWSGRRAFEAGDPEACPVDDAIAMKEMGDHASARALLMEELHEDLRYLDAHVHLGNMDFDHWPHRALAHYEVAVHIGGLSLPDDAALLLPGDCITNRPYHRALHGYGLTLWRLERRQEASATFDRLLFLDPSDGIGARFARLALAEGLAWEQWRDGWTTSA